MNRRVHERRITLKDLLEDQQMQQQQRDENRTEGSPSSLYFSLPKLESMVLDGRWVFEEKVLEALCLFVAPNLHWVYFGRGCVGYTLQEWIPLARKMPLIDTVGLNLPLTRAEVREITELIVPEHELQDEQRNKKRIQYQLYATPAQFNDYAPSQEQ